MDMSIFDAQENEIKSFRGKREHRNKKESHNPEDVTDLRKKANRREKPRNRQYVEDEE